MFVSSALFMSLSTREDPRASSIMYDQRTHRQNHHESMCRSTDNLKWDCCLFCKNLYFRPNTVGGQLNPSTRGGFFQPSVLWQVFQPLHSCNERAIFMCVH